MGRTVTILLVEDSEDDAFFFQLGTRDAEAKVIRVITAEAAILHLKTNPLPDLIVADLKLPGMSVNTFLDWIRLIPGAQKIPVVLHTGAAMVPEEIKTAVQHIFFKGGNLTQNRQTVLEIIRLADHAEPKLGL
jgi:CheY-like chemotaxis protein